MDSKTQFHLFFAFSDPPDELPQPTKTPKETLATNNIPTIFLAFI